MAELQSVVFQKDKWTIPAARKWLREHNIKPIKDVDETTNTYRFRTTDPKKYIDFRTKTTPDNVLLVIGIMKLKFKKSRKRKRKSKRPLTQSTGLFVEN